MKKQIFADPFTLDFNPDSNEDYLNLAISNFLNLEDKPQVFYDTINKLFRVQQRLKIVANVAKLPELQNGFNHFKQAIDWLRMSVAIAASHSIPVINSYDEIDETNSQAFGQFVSWFESAYLANQQTYLYAVFSLSATQIDSTEIIRNQTSNLKGEITKTGNKKIEEIINTSKVEKGKLSEFVALDEWAKHYDKLVNAAGETLYGENHIESKPKRFLHFFNPKPLSKRLFYCWVLFAIVILIALAQDWPSVWGSFSTQNLRVIGDEIFSHIWLFIFPSIFYSFTIKNYRVTRNQMAQNQQRATNARVLQNMLEAKESISPESMTQIVAYASESLFAIKNTGELSKKEIESSGAISAIKSFIK
ncbi:hypothetical protein FWC31_03380 [Candidatus Saccharibacteria bacterium]|nr:hypothetical protein [Candidatus Saccharibacteria bacterium]